MKVTTLFSAAVVIAITSAYLEPPPTTAASDTIQDCSWWEVATTKDQCAAIQTSWFLTAAQFKAYVSIPYDYLQLLELIDYHIESICNQWHNLQLDCWKFILRGAKLWKPPCRHFHQLFSISNHHGQRHFYSDSYTSGHD